VKVSDIAIPVVQSIDVYEWIYLEHLNTLHDLSVYFTVLFFSESLSCAVHTWVLFL
jgi:hypothetical protein